MGRDLKNGPKKKKWGIFLNEFREHLPFAILVSVLALGFVILGNVLGYRFGENLFEKIHFIHLFFSAAATSMIYFHYKKNFFAGILVGISGAILLGSLSDILFPYIVVSIFRFPALFHLPLIEAPALVLVFSFIGSIFGQVVKKNRFPHSAHVFLSVFASLFYLVNYVVLTGIFSWTIAFLTLVFAVWLPCCLSDLAFPLLFIRKGLKCVVHGCGIHKHS
jgi:hypothetical protein